MKVGVLMGGNSSEWEVSLNTGQTVSEAVERIGWDAHPCPYEDDISSVIPTLKTVDVVFNALHGGEGENGVVQGILEKNGIRYTGSGPEASALAMDKQKTKVLLSRNSIATPPWLFLPTEDATGVNSEGGKITYPVVVKPRADGSTMGVSLVKRAEDFDSAVALAREFGPDVIVERYIPGREITVAILDNSALPVIEIIPTNELYDYQCKYTTGMSQYECPARLTGELAEAVSSASERISSLLGCRHYCRVDFRLNSDGLFFCLEVNTLPGLTGTSLVPKAGGAKGISFEELIEKIVTAALKNG
ncbi:MAG: D-alanine--D-alanine ligase [Candidatus Neomarinimicrobiota bacterium]